MINKTAVERGFFWSTTFKTHSDCEKKEGYSSEIIGLPPLNSRRNDKPAQGCLFGRAIDQLRNQRHRQACRFSDRVLATPANSYWQPQ